MEKLNARIRMGDAGEWDVTLLGDADVDVAELKATIYRWISRNKFIELETAKRGDEYTLTLSPDNNGVWVVDDCEYVN